MVLAFTAPPPHRASATPDLTWRGGHSTSWPRAPGGRVLAGVEGRQWGFGHLLLLIRGVCSPTPLGREGPLGAPYRQLLSSANPVETLEQESAGEISGLVSRCLGCTPVGRAGSAALHGNLEVLGGRGPMHDLWQLTFSWSWKGLHS